MIISNLKIKIQLYGSPNVLSQLLILLLGGLGSHINFSKFVEEEVMSSREARYLIQSHPFGKCWLKSAISGLRLWILCSFQQSRLTPKGVLGKRGQVQKTELLFWRNAVILRGNCPPKWQKRRCDFPECFHDNTSPCHRSIQINIKVKNKDIINFALKIWVSCLGLLCIHFYDNPHNTNTSYEQGRYSSSLCPLYKWKTKSKRSEELTVTHFYKPEDASLISSLLPASPGSSGYRSWDWAWGSWWFG